MAVILVLSVVFMLGLLVAGSARIPGAMRSEGLERRVVCPSSQFGRNGMILHRGYAMVQSCLVNTRWRGILCSVYDL